MERINFILTSEEKKILKELADEAKLSISAYIREKTIYEKYSLKLERK